jgi:Ca-activated chloride channel family protein
MKGPCIGLAMFAVVLQCLLPAGAQSAGTADTSISALMPDAVSGDDARITIRKSVAEVDLPLTVTGQDQRPVTNLEAANFTVLDSGTPVSLLDLRSNTDLPLQLGVLLDRSESVSGSFESQKQAAVTFIQRVVRSSGDKIFLGGFDTRIDDFHPLTGDTATLLSTAEKIKQGQLTALHDAVYELAFNLDQVHEGPARKAIILFSDGDDTVSRRGFGEMLAMAQKAGVPVYSISMRSKRQSGGRNPLMRLSDETGGRAYLDVVPSQLDRIFAEIERELRAQYVLIFRPQREAGKGQFHPLTVSVRVTGASVRCRSGYFER